MSDPQSKDDPLAARRAAADSRVRAALDHIEKAQMLLGHACAALSDVVGMNPSWREVSKRYEQVHGTWYAVEQKAARLRGRGALLLDRAPTLGEASPSHERRVS